jgi:hypothetical protein
LVNGELFHWHWRSAVGRSGGMLLGIRDDSLEVGGIDQGLFFSLVQQFCIEIQVSNLSSLGCMVLLIMADPLNSWETWRLKCLALPS